MMTARSRGRRRPRGGPRLSAFLLPQTRWEGEKGDIVVVCKLLQERTNASFPRIGEFGGPGKEMGRRHGAPFTQCGVGDLTWPFGVTSLRAPHSHLSIAVAESSACVTRPAAVTTICFASHAPMPPTVGRAAQQF